MAVSRPASQLGPLPLILGVTGHRDLRDEDLPALRAAVRSVFESYRTRMPHTPITLLSSLADGADQLVAEVAIESGCELVVPLPMPIPAFRNTIDGERGRAQFDALLARASAHFGAPALNATIDLGSAGNDARYANCAADIVSRCSEQLALWDGKAATGTAGTAATVQFMLHGVPEPSVADRSDLYPVPIGPVVHIVTPRISNPSQQGKPFAVKRLYPPCIISQVDNEDVFNDLLDHLEVYNRDALECANVRDICEFTTEQLQATAEVLSSYYQSRTQRVLLSVLGLAFAAALFFDLYVTRIVQSVVALAAYFGLTLAAMMFYYFSQRGAWQDRYQDYRSLGEALRVAMFWERAGVQNPVSEVIARLQRGEVSWLPVAIRALVERWPDRNAAPPAADAAALRDVYENWVADQAAWYARRIKEKRRFSSRASWVAFVAIVVAEVIVLFQLPAAMHVYREDIFLASGLLAISAALIRYYADKRGWVEEMKEYIRVGALFGHAREQLQTLLSVARLDPASTARIQRMLHELGQEALRENMAWRTLHRQRPIKLPHAHA